MPSHGGQDAEGGVGASWPIGALFAAVGAGSFLSRAKSPTVAGETSCCINPGLLQYLAVGAFDVLSRCNKEGSAGGRMLPRSRCK